MIRQIFRGIFLHGHYVCEEALVMRRRHLLYLTCAAFIVISVTACKNVNSTSSASLDQQYAGGMAEKALYTEPVDYTPDIKVNTESDISAVRSELNRYLFATDTLPDTMPEVNGNHIIVSMQNGFTSCITAYRSISPNGSLIIYHDGHDGNTMSDAVPIQRFLANGYTVWRMDMPLIGDNREPVWVDLPRIGRVPITQHEEMIFLYEMTTGSPVRYFIEPVIAAVNLARVKGYKNIFMVGLSGGGWTTTVVAALDARITASYPVAGSVPMAMHFDRYKKNWGDWEQVVPEMYRIASYEDLYIMGSLKRSQIQVLNEFDICCFNEPRYVLYEPAIQDVLKSVGGEFDVFWAKGDILHWACPSAVDRILDDMRLRSK
jgi:hypothetical protein